jgi:hypothetical protein
MFGPLTIPATYNSHEELYRFASDIQCRSISLMGSMLEAVDFVKVGLNITKQCMYSNPCQTHRYARFNDR